jgi:hypothetical protein
MAMELNEAIAEITCTLTRANDSRSQFLWMKLIEEKELYFGVNLPKSTDLGYSFSEG